MRNRRARGERVIVTCPEQVGVLAAVRALRAAGHEPWVAGSSRAAYSAASRATAGFRRVPAVSDAPEAFAAAVGEAAAEIDAAVVVPGTERAMIALTAFRPAMPEEARVAAPLPEAASRLTAKTRLDDLARAGGFAVPESVVLRRRDAATWSGGVPVVVKPIRSEGWDEARLVHGTSRVARTTAELEEMAAATPGDHLILQRHVRGSLDAVAAVAWKGELVGPVQFRADRTWPAAGGILATGETMPLDEPLVAGLRAIVRATAFDGLLQAQFIRSADRAYLIDINPRIYASLALAIAAGTNLPAIWVDLLLGREPTIHAYAVGTRFCSEPYAARLAIAAATRGDVKGSISALRPRARTAWAIWSHRDPLPAVLGTVLGVTSRAAGHGSGSGATRRQRTVPAEGVDSGRETSDPAPREISPAARRSRAARKSVSVP